MSRPHWSSRLPELTGEVECIAEYDNSGDYEFNAVAIVKDAKGYHVVSSAGCSCPSREEQAQYDAGPFDSFAAALANVPESHRAGVEADR